MAVLSDTTKLLDQLKASQVWSLCDVTIEFLDVALINNLKLPCGAGSCQ